MNRKHLRHIIASSAFALLAGGIFWFMFGNIFSHLPALSSYPWKADWFFLVSSLGLSILASLLALKAGHILCMGMGNRVPYLRFIFVFCVSQLSRYLPGRIWPVIGLSLLLEREGVRRSVSVAFPFVYQGTMVIIFFLVGLIYCGPSVAARLLHQSGYLVGIVSFGLVCFLLIVPALSRLLEGVTTIRIKRGHYYWGVLFFLMSALALSGAFFVFLYSVAAISPRDVFHVAGSFLLSYVMGWVVMIAPAGLGVREGTLGLLLSSVLPASVSNVVALAARVWMTVAELLLLGGVLLVLKMTGEGRLRPFNPGVKGENEKGDE